MNTLPSGNRAKLKLRFASNIKQISETEIEVDISTSNFDCFTPELCAQVCKELGLRDGERLLDEMADNITREIIIRGII